MNRSEVTVVQYIHCLDRSMWTPEVCEHHHMLPKVLFFSNGLHKVGGTELHIMSLYAVALQFLFTGTKRTKPELYKDMVP